MISRTLPGLAIVVLLIGCHSRDKNEPPTHDVRFRDRETGEVYDVTETEKVTAYAELDANGKEVKKPEMLREAHFVYTEEILDIPDAGPPPSAIRRVYSTADLQRSGDSKKPIPRLQNATVTLKLAGSTYLVEAGAQETGKLFEGDFPWLQGRFQDMLKSNRLRVGESWEIAKDVAGRQFCVKCAQLDLEHSKATGILQRVYQKDDRQFGVFQMDFEFIMFQGVPEVPAVRHRRTITLDACVDGTSSEFSASLHYIDDRVAPFTDSRPPGYTGMAVYVEGTDEISCRLRK